jgi:hypothetical protein
MALDDRTLPLVPEWLIECVRAVRPAGGERPASYAPVLSRLQRGQPAATGDRRRRARVLPGEKVRGRVVDLEG